MNRILNYWKVIFRILFSHGHKVLLIHEAKNPNLGDQAQRMCTLQWIRDNYPNSVLLEIGDFGSTLSFDVNKWTIFTDLACLIKLAVLKIKVRSNDLLLGHSGYFMVDHHSGYKAFLIMMRHFPKNKLVILPQTVNFYTPYVKLKVSQGFATAKNVTLLCRDKVSYSKAKEMYPTTKLLLFPDIVTSLIGTRKYNGNREGVLFCMRDDVEMFYHPEQIDALMKRFGEIRIEKIDTTLHGVNAEYVNCNRDKLIWETIDKFATYKVVITDRYHGTIFSAIAATPVIVISSADHKLSSGVNWFPKEEFGDYIQFAKDLDEAYDKAFVMLNQFDLEYSNPPYFKINYWDKLKIIANL